MKARITFPATASSTSAACRSWVGNAARKNVCEMLPRYLETHIHLRYDLYRSPYNKPIYFNYDLKMLQKNLLSKSLWCNTDTSRLIVIVHVRAVEVRDKEGHCAPTEGTARMINDCSLNSPKKRWKSDKASAGGRGRAPEDIPGAEKRGRINREQPAGAPAACRLGAGAGRCCLTLGLVFAPLPSFANPGFFLAAFLPRKAALGKADDCPLR